MDLSGKVAIITGGAQGLGKAFAGALLKRGANVVLGDVSASIGLDTANEFLEEYGTGRAFFVYCDVTDDHQYKNLFQKAKSMYGNVDIVVNNAGVGHEDQWKKMIEINLSGVVCGTYLGLEYMNKDNSGRGGLIINIGSTAGLTVVAFEPVYSGTKAGVVMFTRSVAARHDETTEQDIRVVCLCPSFTDTRMVGMNREGERDQIMDNMGIMKIDRVVESFLKLVDDKGNNGGILALTPNKMFYRYPRELNSKL